MIEIAVRETNFSNSQIAKMKEAGILSNYGFDGGLLYYTLTDKNKTKAKAILGKSILSIKPV